MAVSRRLYSRPVNQQERPFVSDGASDGTLVPLNRSEHMYWAGEGYLGPINMPFMLRFDRPVDEALLRQALRELTTAFPRLRGVVVPTAFTYKLRILPDDLWLDQLFNDARPWRLFTAPSSTSPFRWSAACPGGPVSSPTSKTPCWFFRCTT